MIISYSSNAHWNKIVFTIFLKIDIAGVDRASENKLIVL